MIKQITCPECNSTNCEKATSSIRKKHKYLYPDKARKIRCYLCYDCGASETSLEMKK